MPDPKVDARGNGLSEDERVELNRAQFLTPNTLEDNPVHQAVERILAARLAAVEAERDDALARLAEAGAQALEDYAAELDWVRPEVSPCAPNFEGCCGSEESCDAMQPFTRVVGAASLRKRAAQLRVIPPADGYTSAIQRGVKQPCGACGGSLYGCGQSRCCADCTHIIPPGSGDTDE